MPRHKTMDRPKRFNAVVDQQTYLKLVSLAGRQTMIEGKPVSLASIVRSILVDAVNRSAAPDSYNYRDAKEMAPACGRQDMQGVSDE